MVSKFNFIPLLHFFFFEKQSLKKVAQCHNIVLRDPQISTELNNVILSRQILMNFILMNLFFQ